MSFLLHCCPRIFRAYLVQESSNLLPSSRWFQQSQCMADWLCCLWGVVRQSITVRRAWKSKIACLMSHREQGWPFLYFYIPLNCCSVSWKNTETWQPHGFYLLHIRYVTVLYVEYLFRLYIARENVLIFALHHMHIKKLRRKK
jgi:hypothetical protein